MSNESIAYGRCLAQEGQGSEAEILLCLANAYHTDVRALEADAAQFSVSIVNWLLVIAGAMVYFMQAGFAMLCAGCVRKKNVQNTMLKNLMDACVACVAFYTVGYGFAFGQGGTYIGQANFFGRGDIDLAFWFFQYAFSATAVTIVAGTLAERCKMNAYFVYSFFLAGFVYPVVVRAIWSSDGFLSAFSAEPLGGIGTIDFAGSGVVHCTGGFTALLATLIVGPRIGRFYDEDGEPLAEPKNIRGHSMALQLMGTMTLWYGCKSKLLTDVLQWHMMIVVPSLTHSSCFFCIRCTGYGFNCGSALLLGENVDSATVATRVAMNTTIAAACGALSALFTKAFTTGRTGEGMFDLTVVMNGALTALVSITAPCGTVEPWAAAVIGSVGGWFYLFGTWALDKLRIDDAVDAIPVHLLGGMWGLISTGLFTSPGALQEAFGTDQYVGLFYAIGRDDFTVTLLQNQCYAILFILVWCTICMTPFFFILSLLGFFRVAAKDEVAGLDSALHAADMLPAVVKELKVAKERARQKKFMEASRQETAPMVRDVLPLVRFADDSSVTDRVVP
jgi:Amt family ammonium transporter